jgi:hypothetical protein
MVNAYRFGASALVTSIGLADVVADAVGITRESAQLHLKTIRAAGEITFKGYGRAAAAMAPLDASRLLIAVAGSTFAKDSIEVLRRFAKLKPLRDTGPKTTLEEFLARRIEALPEERNYTELSESYHSGRQSPIRRSFGSRRLSKVALELMWAAGLGSEDLPPYGVVRWLSSNGDTHTLVFGSPPETPGPGHHHSERQVHDRYDLLDAYPDSRMFQMRIVTRDALIDIAEAVK